MLTLLQDPWKGTLPTSLLSCQASQKLVKDMKIPAGMLIVAIERDDQVIVPGGGDELLAGDQIFARGEPRAIESFEKKIGDRRSKPRKIVVFGGTRIAQHVCSALQREHVSVQMIVEERAEAERMSEALAGVTVLHGSATDINVLKEERVAEVDAFLGISDQDERNLMSCQLARNLGTRSTVALVHKPDYVSLYQQLGIDIAVSPRLLCANRILAFVRSRSISSIATIAEGKAEVLEIEVQAGSKLAGKQIKDAGLPRGCVVAAITREDGSVVIPGGGDEILAQEQMVLFVLEEVVDEVLGLAGIVRE